MQQQQRHVQRLQRIQQQLNCCSSSNATSVTAASTAATAANLGVVAPALKLAGGSIESDMTYVSLSAAHGITSLLGHSPDQAGGFDSCLTDMKLLVMADGHAKTSLLVTAALANAYGTLHGGAIATIIDIVGTFAQMSTGALPGVSVEMNQSFMSAIKIGDTLLCHGELIKKGRSIAFTQVTLRRESDGKVVAMGRHTKAF